MGFLVVGVLAVHLYFEFTGKYSWSTVDGDETLLARSSTDHPRLLLAVRATFLIFNLVVICLGAVGVGNNGGKVDFRFYTVWNFAALIIVFALLTAHSVAFFLGKVLHKKISRLTWVLYQVELCNVFVVDVILWVVLYPMADGEVLETLLHFFSYTSHGANALMMIIEMVMNDLDVRASHIIFMYFGILLYTLVTWIRRANDGLLEPNNTWPYPFMETSTQEAPLWYGGIFIGTSLFYAFVWLLSCCKSRTCRRRKERRDYYSISG